MPPKDPDETILPKKNFYDNLTDHVARYIFASNFVEGKNVLDFGCGRGYGTYFLSKKATRIIGIDINHNYISYAKSLFKSQNLQYYTLDSDEEIISTSDVIVCFEVFEHVSNINQTLKTIKSWLNDDGIFIASTPNKELSPQDQGRPFNKYHVKEYTRDEFYVLLSQFFNHIEIVGQRLKNENADDIQDYLSKVRLWTKIPKRMRNLVPSFVQNKLVNTLKTYRVYHNASWQDYIFDDFNPKLSTSLISICKK